MDLSPIFCINLDQYPEKWKRTKTEIKRAFRSEQTEPKLHRFSGIDRTNDPEPGRGCGESFCQLISKAKANRWPYLIICEDDVQFVKGAHEKIKKAMACRPKDADILLFGSYCLQFGKGTIHNNHWLSINGSYASHHFVIFFKSIYDKVLEFKNHEKYRHLDRFIGNRFVAKSQVRAYVIWPMVAKQYDGFSTTMKKNVQYNTSLWTCKHNLLWYNQEHHEHLSAFDTPPVVYSDESFAKYSELLSDYERFIVQKGSKSKSIAHSEEELHQLALYWYGMPTILDTIQTRLHGISVSQFKEFRKNIQNYYNTVQNDESIEVDTAHLVLAYNHPTEFNFVVKQKYKVSYEEFNKILQQVYKQK